MGKFFLILLITILSSPCIDLEAQLYNFKQVSLPGHVSGNVITDIAQDTDGNLWLTSFDGLYKYDGSTSVIYKHDPSNPASTPSASDAETVCADRKGFIWVGTDGGLDRLDPQTGIFTHFKSNPKDANSLSYNHINVIREDHVILQCIHPIH